MQDKNNTNVEIGRRLEFERSRLRMKHDEFAKAGGVATSTYSNYSSGEREPKTSFLTAIHEIGADVLYILTGQRTPNAEQTLAPDEAALLDNYRNTTPERKASLREVGVAFAQPGVNKKAG